MDHLIVSVAVPSFAYMGAWSSPLYGLQIAPSGTASARVERTGSFGMTVIGKGQRYQVTVDFKRRAIKTVRDCSCLVDVTLATGLTSSARHPVGDERIERLPIPPKLVRGQGGGASAGLRTE